VEVDGGATDAVAVVIWLVKGRVVGLLLLAGGGWGGVVGSNRWWARERRIEAGRNERLQILAGFAGDDGCPSRPEEKTPENELDKARAHTWLWLLPRLTT
jgi:hypothetical protein